MKACSKMIKEKDLVDSFGVMELTILVTGMLIRGMVLGALLTQTETRTKGCGKKESFKLKKNHSCLLEMRS